MLHSSKVFALYQMADVLMQVSAETLLMEGAVGQYLEQKTVGSIAGRVPWDGYFRDIWWECT